MQFFKHYNIRTKLFLWSTQNQCCFIVKFRRWFNVDKLTLSRRWNTVTNTVTFSTLIKRFYFFKHHGIRTNLFLESTKNQRCFKVESYRWINVGKSKSNQRRYHVDNVAKLFQHISYINVESTLNVFAGYCFS